MRDEPKDVQPTRTDAARRDGSPQDLLRLALECLVPPEVSLEAMLDRMERVR